MDSRAAMEHGPDRWSTASTSSTVERGGIDVLSK